jgi:hypothetical protein
MVKPAFIFDGRNTLDHKKLHAIGFNIYAIGKPPMTHFSASWSALTVFGKVLKKATALLPQAPTSTYLGVKSQKLKIESSQACTWFGKTIDHGRLLDSFNIDEVA